MIPSTAGATLGHLACHSLQMLPFSIRRRCYTLDELSLLITTSYLLQNDPLPYGVAWTHFACHCLPLTSLEVDSRNVREIPYQFHSF